MRHANQNDGDIYVQNVLYTPSHFVIDVWVLAVNITAVEPPPPRAPGLGFKQKRSVPSFFLRVPLGGILEHAWHATINAPTGELIDGKNQHGSHISKCVRISA